MLTSTSSHTASFAARVEASSPVYALIAGSISFLTISIRVSASMLMVLEYISSRISVLEIISFSVKTLWDVNSFTFFSSTKCGIASTAVL